MDDSSNYEGNLGSLFQGKYFESYEEVIGKTLNGKPLLEKKDDKIYGNDFSLWGFKEGTVENLIFSAPKVRIKDYKRLSFKNCIFCGQVTLGDDESIYTEVDNCYVCGELGITLHQAQKNEIKLVSSNCNRVTLFNNRFSEISVLFTRVNKLEITDNKQLDRLSVFANEIQQFVYSNNSAAEVFFPSSQIDPNRILIIKEKIETQFLSPYSDSTWGERQSDFHLLHTIDFLLEKTNLKFDNPRKAKFQLIRVRNSLKPGPIKAIFSAFGYFFKPLNVFVCMVIIVVLFSVLYFLNFELLRMADSCNLNLYQRMIDSLYFSGITFLTIGYGDITPLGWLKVFAVIEGFLGVFLSSTFLVSLAKKYTET